jgi:uncharacterized RDD family membrane protein YckC
VALRVLQFALDLALSAVLCLAPLALLLLLPENPDGTLGALWLAIPLLGLAMVVGIGLSWWYWAVLPRRWSGRTPAMRWLGLRVVGLDGRDASLGQLGARWLMLLVDAMLFGLVGLVAMLATPHRQRLGDVLAGTVVVRAPGWMAPEPD